MFEAKLLQGSILKKIIEAIREVNIIIIFSLYCY